ncbi:hypothetical protein ACFLSQ_11080 [Bacteroidota bacterium]
MLQPLFDNFSSRVEEGNRILTFDIPARFDEESVLAKLKFKVALGNDTITPLTLSNVRLLGKGKTALSINSGEFRLKGYCTKGGLRLFESDGKIVLLQNRPNPFENSTTLEFEIFEGGQTRLFIMDMIGKVVKTIVNGSLSPGEHSYQVEAPELPSGSYYYILQTPTYRICRRMEIRR